MRLVINVPTYVVSSLSLSLIYFYCECIITLCRSVILYTFRILMDSIIRIALLVLNCELPIPHAPPPVPLYAVAVWFSCFILWRESVKREV